MNLLRHLLFYVSIAILLGGCSSSKSKSSNVVQISEILARIETTKQPTIVLIAVDEGSRKKHTYVSWEAKTGVVAFEAAIGSTPYVLDLGSLKIDHLAGEVVVDRGWLSKKTLKIAVTYHGQKMTSDASIIGKSREPLVTFIENHEIDRKFFVVVVNL
jgi:hypothetical protein